MPAFSFCGAECSAGGSNHVPVPSERFQGVPGRESLISVSFFGSGELVGELRQLAHRDTECGGDVTDRCPGGVAVATFDHRERRDCDARSLSNGLLRFAFLLANSANRLTERWLWSR